MATKLQSELSLDSQSTELSHLNGFAVNTKSENEAASLEDCMCTTSIDNKKSNETSIFEKSEIPTLVHLFTGVYHQRIAEIEKNDSLDINKKNEAKLIILQSHLEQLEEQNNVLVATLIELEVEVQQRVQQMEKRLKSSAKTTMEAVINVHECEKEMARIIEERLCIESLFSNLEQNLSSVKVENTYLRDQNFNLNHDVQSLLHVIHHARSTGHWEMNCVTFCEVTPEQVFGPVQSISSMYSTDSPQFEFPLQSATKKHTDACAQVLNSNHETHHPSQSHPRNTLYLQTQHHDNHMEILKKEKKIAVLESHLSELRHQLTLKEAVCECHSWKFDSPIEPNIARLDAAPVLPLSRSLSQQKGISLPDIGNIYSCADVMRKSFTCQTLSCTQKSSTINTQRTKIKPNINNNENSSRASKKNEKNNFNNFALCRAQSEPHLFMFGDDIYVYRPCEHIKKASNIALHDEFQLNLPPCQSIDLKFPSEDSNLKVCDWDFLSNNPRCNVPDSSYCKIRESSSSCLSSCSGDDKTSRELISNSVSMDPSAQLSELTKCKTCQINEHLVSVRTFKDNCNFNHSNIETVSSSVQTEIQKTYSIGLQADINTGDVKVQDMNENALLEMDVQQIKRTMQAFKDSALKAEDKAKAKEILIEQLQTHLASTVHEKDLKDHAFINVEKKLDNSRVDCAALRNEISTLNSEMQQVLSNLQDAQMLNDNLFLKIEAKEEKFEDVLKEQKILQEQKRALMIQLDAEGDELENVKKELDAAKTKLQTCSLQLEQQSQIIRNLQEALVQSKRAFDAAYPKMSDFPTNSSLNNLHSDASSKSSIIDI